MLPTFFYAQKGKDFYINQLLPSGYKDADVDFTVGGNYPTGETVDITVNKCKGKTLNIRIPSWCENPSVTVNGTAVQGVKAGAYLTLKRTWKAGDKIAVNLPMKLQWVRREHHADYEKYYLQDGEIMYREHPTNNVPYAFMRGPVVYCVDMVWNPQIGNDDVDIKNNMAFDVSKLPTLVDAPSASLLGPCYQADAVYMGRSVKVTLTPFCTIGQWWRNGEEKVAGWANAYSYAIWLSKK